jgi:uncharacterized membrane protein YphA (DoxX/SURF4 family)
MSAVFTVLRVLFGLTFLAAAVSKAAYPVEFAAIVANYQLLPDALVNPVAMVLPWVEVVCGAALVAGFWPRGAALVLCGLLVVFLGALGFNAMRGLSVQCGCFSVAPQAGASMRADMIRDAVILAVGLVVFGHAVWEERRRRASARFWEVFSRPAVPSMGTGETLIVGGAATFGAASGTFSAGTSGEGAGETQGETFDAASDEAPAAAPIPVFAAPEAAPALALEAQQEALADREDQDRPAPVADGPDAPGQPGMPTPEASPASGSPDAPGGSGSTGAAANDEDDEDARKF